MIIRGDGIKKDFYRKSRNTNIFTAVYECDIELPEGSIVVVRGRSGGGKSTLLNMLSGNLEPTEGTVYYDDLDIYTMSDIDLSSFRASHIGMIPQGRSAIASLNVYENIVLPYTLYGEEIDCNVDDLMERFDIARLRDAMPGELSGGELRRMAIARSMVKDPDIIFADEPTGDLDDENTEIVLKSLRELSDSGTTIMMVTHDGEAEKYADILYRMDGGRCILQDREDID